MFCCAVSLSILRVVPTTMSKNSQRYYTTKRHIRDLLSSRQVVMSVWTNFKDIYLRGQKYAMRNGIGAGNPAN